MPRRPRRSKLRPPDQAATVVTPPPWGPMDPNDEAAARESYLHAYQFAGGTPCALVGETVLGSRERCGGAPRSVWEAIRFDPDPELRRRTLRRTLQWLATSAWRALEVAEADPDDAPWFGKPYPDTEELELDVGQLWVHLAANRYSGGFAALSFRCRPWEFAPGEFHTTDLGEVRRLRQENAQRSVEYLAELDSFARGVTDPVLTGLRVTESAVVEAKGKGRRVGVSKRTANRKGRTR